jgi:hypothetical protein
MSIKDLREKINSGINSQNGRNIYVILIIVLVSLASFGLGRLSKIEEGRPPVNIINRNTIPAIANTAISPTPNIGEEVREINEQYVASKNGSKYHLPWCSGAQRIKEENKIWFETKEEAERASYSPAANCKGL